MYQTSFYDTMACYMTHKTHKTENQQTSRHRHTIHEISLLLGLLALGVVLWTLAYQVPIHVRLAIGGNATTHRREYDAPFLHGFNHSEPYDRKHVEWWTLEPGYAYRWASGDASIRIPGIGSQQWVLTMLATSGRPDNTATTSTWKIGTRTLPPIELPANSRAYHILATPNAMGDLVIHMHTSRFETPEDPRDLGFALRQITVAPTRHTLHQVPLAQIGWLAATLVLIYPLSRWLALRVRQAIVLSLAYIILIAILLATYRIALTLFTPTLATLALSCWALGAVLVAVAHSLFPSTRSGNQSTKSSLFPSTRSGNNTIKPLVALVLLAFALRLGGMLHPHAIFSDHRLNANNLFDTTRGTMYFTEGLPSEAGSGQAPYPPATYVLMAPLQLLAPTTMDGRVYIVQSSIAFFDSLVLALLWGIIRSAGLSHRAAYIAAALYLAPAPIMKSFSIGEYANIGGQALAIPAIVSLALLYKSSTKKLSKVGIQPPKRQEHQGLMGIWFIPVLCVALLGHMGVALSLVLVLVAWWGIHAFHLLREMVRGKRGSATYTLTMRILRAYTLNGLVAATITVFVYYSAPIFVQTFAARISGNTDAANHTSAPNIEVLTTISTIAKELFAGHGKLVPHLVACSIAGLLLLWHTMFPELIEENSNVERNADDTSVGNGNEASTENNTTKRNTPTPMTKTMHRLWHMLLAWWLGVLLSFGLLLVAQQGVRWQHFLYPALCISAGPALATLARRGLAGHLVSWLSMLIPILYGLQLWIHHLHTYLHE